MSVGDGFGTRLTLHPSRLDLEKSTRVPTPAGPTQAQWDAYHHTFGTPQPASVMALRGKVLDALRLIVKPLHGDRRAVTVDTCWREFDLMNAQHCETRDQIDALIKLLEGEQPATATSCTK